MKSLLVRDLLSGLENIDVSKRQRSPEFLEWISSDLVSIAGRFTAENKLQDSYFTKSLNKVFGTDRFGSLLNRWTVEYLLRVFRAFNSGRILTLEDSPLNRLGAREYGLRFKNLPEIRWCKQSGILKKLFSILIRNVTILILSLDKGLRLSGRRKRFKVMREALWGMYDVRGYYFHDDFFVDSDKIKKQDVVLFSRGIPEEKGRLKSYVDAKKSPYAYFNLSSLRLSARCLFSRLIPKYIISGAKALLKETASPNFSIYWSLFSCFVYNALPYEKIFSNFDIASELGHGYFSIGHIPESIVCQSYGAKYYLMHWSDNSVEMDRFLLSFLGCDSFLLWGKAHLQGVEGRQDILVPTGYVFKRFINKASSMKEEILRRLKINVSGRIISFFDESFGRECKMQEKNYIVFWETMLKVAKREKNHTVIVKPKDLARHNNLSDGLKKRFISIKDELEHMPNVYLMTSEKWSFVEIIGISDIVITQGMTSSATIAIICGIQGLYLDQTPYNHPLTRLFKDKLVFDDPDKLSVMITKILSNEESPIRDIPEGIKRSFDTYSDDRGIDIFRSILSGEAQKKIGIVIQARMGSTRLPGKVMRCVSGRSMLGVLIDRLRRSRKSQILIIATTNKREDDAIERLADEEGVFCFRGDEDDVLKRFYGAAKTYGLDVIVRITSDCPFADPLLIDKMIDSYLDNPQVDYVSNTIKRTYPRGFDIEVFSFESLRRAKEDADTNYQKEHVTPFIYENMKCLSYEDSKDSSGYRVTVDTIEDLELVSSIYSILNKDSQFGYRQVVDFLDSRPDLAAINQGVRQKAVK